MTVIGVDVHKQTHTCAAVDQSGRKLGQKTVPASRDGHAAALAWARATFGGDVVWGLEDQRNYTALLERDLLQAHQVVVRVPSHLMARNRGSARAWGKSDPIDALAVALAVLREPNLPTAVHDSLSWEMKLLVDRREDLVMQRVGTVNRLLGRLHLLNPERPRPVHLERRRTRDTLAEYLHDEPGLIAELARQELADLNYFSDQVEVLTKRIVDRVQSSGSTLTSIVGCAELTAARLIAETANMDRFRNEAAFARYTGVAPVPMSSGRTDGRLRLSRSGNRRCNKAIHNIAVVQIRLEGPGRTYYLRRREGGDTGRMAIRALSRRICRVVYNRLVTDYRTRSAG